MWRFQGRSQEPRTCPRTSHSQPCSRLALGLLPSLTNWGSKGSPIFENHHICPVSVIGLGNGAGANIITRWEVKSHSNREAWIQESQVRNDAPDSRARNSDGEQHSHWKSRKVHWQTEGASWWQLWEIQHVLFSGETRRFETRPNRGTKWKATLHYHRRLQPI